MLPDEPRLFAERYVPGTGPVDIHRSGGGLVNETYRVVRGGAAFALRMAASNPYDLGVDRDWEWQVLKAACAADLAPAVEHFDPRRGVLITRWEAGESWSEAAVRRPTNIRRMAGLMRRIHALPVPAPARLMSPARWIDYYRVGDHAGAAAALRPTAALRLAVLARLPMAAPALCHSDLHPLNLIDRGASLILLDWEYAHASDPLWDLAGWSANNDLEESLQHDLLRSYLRRSPTGNEYLRLHLLGWLYDYICLLWSELYLNLAREGRPDAALASRAHLLSARLAHSK
jgi:thiamine kinase